MPSVASSLARRRPVGGFSMPQSSLPPPPVLPGLLLQATQARPAAAGCFSPHPSGAVPPPRSPLRPDGGAIVASCLLPTARPATGTQAQTPIKGTLGAAEMKKASRWLRHSLTSEPFPGLTRQTAISATPLAYTTTTRLAAPRINQARLAAASLCWLTVFLGLTAQAQEPIRAIVKSR